MNVNLHIERIVLEGVELAAGEERVLQLMVAEQLTAMLTQQRFGSSFFVGEFASHWDSIQLGGSADAATLSPKLAGAIYESIHRSDGGTPTRGGGL